MYLEYLTAGGQWSTAAVKLQHLLGDQANLWERWVYVFAQVGGSRVLGGTSGSVGCCSLVQHASGH